MAATTAPTAASRPTSPTDRTSSPLLPPRTPSWRGTETPRSAAGIYRKEVMDAPVFAKPVLRLCIALYDELLDLRSLFARPGARGVGERRARLVVERRARAL